MRAAKIDVKPRKPRKPSSPLEHAETAAVVAWFKLQYPKQAGYLIGLPNAGKRSPRVAAMLKAEGMRPGAFDLFLAIPRWGYHGLWIEMKRRDGTQSDVSDNQARFETDMIAMGYMAQVCFGADEARVAIRAYLDHPA